MKKSIHYLFAAALVLAACNGKEQPRIIENAKAVEIKAASFRTNEPLPLIPWADPVMYAGKANAEGC